MVTQVEIARRVGLDVSSVNKILNRRSGPVFRKETIRKVFKVARDLGYDFNRIKFHHRRRHGRKEVAIGAEFRVFKADGSLHDQGRATIRDLSLSGAKVDGLELPTGTLPVGAFAVSLRPLERSFEELVLSGRVVRMDVESGMAYGIAFAGLEDGRAKRLGRLLGN